ncbi:MAG: 50S ribosomal protein L32e [Candidatus Woesearchaeota archaeon]|nr:50S ribosomal protein L32e [Candidatus Woesearchaeota archaeon]
MAAAKNNTNRKKIQLALREAQKRKRPAFTRHKAHKKIRLHNHWRYPEGIHNKLRHNKAGYGKMVNPGYRSPAEVRGLHKSGLEMIIVCNAKELEKIKKEEQGIIISSSVGMRKRLAIIDAAKKAGISILNLDGDKYAEKARKISEEKKAEEKKREAKKTEEKKEAPKQEKKETEEEISPEDKKEKERREIEKELISRN